MGINHPFIGDVNFGDICQAERGVGVLETGDFEEENFLIPK